MSITCCWCHLLCHVCVGELRTDVPMPMVSVCGKLQVTSNVLYLCWMPGGREVQMLKVVHKQPVSCIVLRVHRIPGEEEVAVLMVADRQLAIFSELRAQRAGSRTLAASVSSSAARESSARRGSCCGAHIGRLCAAGNSIRAVYEQALDVRRRRCTVASSGRS